jgi:hypothetical protein
MGSKTLSFRENRLKSLTTNKCNRLEFIDEIEKKELCTIYKNSENPPPLFIPQINFRGFRS